MGAFRAMANFARIGLEVAIAVTGSVGKTSTKEMLNTILQNWVRPILLCKLNNHWGVHHLTRLPRRVALKLG